MRKTVCVLCSWTPVGAALWIAMSADCSLKKPCLLPPTVSRSPLAMWLAHGVEQFLTRLVLGLVTARRRILSTVPFYLCLCSHHALVNSGRMHDRPTVSHYLSYWYQLHCILYWCILTSYHVVSSLFSLFISIILRAMYTWLDSDSNNVILGIR